MFAKDSSSTARRKQNFNNLLWDYCSTSQGKEAVNISLQAIHVNVVLRAMGTMIWRWTTDFAVSTRHCHRVVQQDTYYRTENLEFCFIFRALEQAFRKKYKWHRTKNCQFSTILTDTGSICTVLCKNSSTEQNIYVTICWDVAAMLI